MLLGMSELQKRLRGYDDNIQTPEEVAMEKRRRILERLMGRNVSALNARVPGAEAPGLTGEESSRVSTALQQAARGGQVDETSFLNQRAGAYNELTRRDEARQAAQDAAYSKRFQALQATRARDEEGNLSAPVASSESSGWRDASFGPRTGKVRTIAEKIEGVEDDPSTPMDESVRYRSEWDFGGTPLNDEERKKRTSEALTAQKTKVSDWAQANRERRKNEQQQGRDAVMSGRLAAMTGKPPEATGNANADRIALQAFMRKMQSGGGPVSDLDRFRQAMGEAMAFDVRNDGKTQLASTVAGKFGDYRVQQLAGQQQKELLGKRPSSIDDNTIKAAELQANMIVEQLNGLDANDPRRSGLEQELEDLRKSLQGPKTAAAQPKAARTPSTLEASAAESAKINALSAATAANKPNSETGEMASPEKAAGVLASAVNSGALPLSEALQVAESQHGPETHRILQEIFTKMQSDRAERLRRQERDRSIYESIRISPWANASAMDAAGSMY